MTESLLKVLALAPGPQTATQVHDSLKRSGLKIDEFEIVKHLRHLQKSGIVQIEGTKWRLLKLPSGMSVAAPPNASNLKAASQQSAATNPLPSSFPTIAPPPAPIGRWSQFRSLCRYYMDCLLQEEAPQLRAYVENEDDTWLAAKEVPWSRLAAGGGFAVSLARAQSLFQRNRVKRGEDECVYVGYPLKLVKCDTYMFVVPLFVQPMQADWRSGILHLQPDGPIAVNGAWLEFQFPKRAEREAFLRAMGLITEVDLDDENGEFKNPPLLDMGRLAQNAAHYVHDADRFAELINPMQLNSARDWKASEPGLYNAAVLTLGPRLKYTRSLLRDLRDITGKFSDEDLDQTALAAIFQHEPPALPAAKPQSADDSAAIPAAFGREDLAQVRMLHPRQRTAVVNALSERVSVVTGPPGTGKSEVVAAMLFNQLLRGKSALFASKNHQALEAVLPRLNAAEGADLIIQSSSRELAQRQNYLGKLQSLLSRPARPDAVQGVAFQEQFMALFAEQRVTLQQIATQADARNEYEILNGQLDILRKSLPVAIQLDEALSRWPDNITSSQIQALATELRLALARPTGVLQKLWHTLRRGQVEARRKAARQPLLGLPILFGDRNIPDVNAGIVPWEEFFTIWTTWAESANVAKLLSNCERRLASLPKADDCNQRLARIQHDIEVLTSEWMAWAAGGLPSLLNPADRQALANLRAGIQNWGPDRFSKELKRHFPLILRVFPLWSVSNLSARSAIPLLPALFDLVIVDEASQCDIASVIPLLARSRHAVLAGDPNQLKHVSTLDASVEQTLLQQYGLTDANLQRFSYRVNSAFGLANDSEGVPESARVSLDLHFRSHDLIADYCNEAFYSKTLHVVTVTDRLKIPQGMSPGIHWTHVIGKMQPGQTGVWCMEEIEAICRELEALAKSGYRGTIGVVTPFRQQWVRLKDKLDAGNSLPPDFLEQVRFLAAAAHGFQGDERDLILFSLCGGPEMPVGSAIFLRENPNLFNVAVSRARAVLHVVGNRDWALACGVPFIENLARRTMPGMGNSERRQRDPYQSPWEKILADALRKAGIKATPQYPIAGRFLDLAVLSPRKIDIEVDGESVHRTAGGGRKDDDHWRDLQLKSLGWEVCRFWVYELREDISRCVQRVEKLLKEPGT